MKNIKKLFISFFVLALAASCDDAHNITQDGEIGDGAVFQKVSDLDAYLKGAVYPNVSISSEILFTSVFTDEVGIGPNNGGQEVGLHRFQLNASTGYPAAIWANHYYVINRVNRLIKASTTIPVEASEEATFNDIIGQAKVLRAFSYLQLLTYFSTDMSDDNALGVMLFDYVPAITEKLPRSKNADVFALIEADLSDAKASITQATPVGAHKFVSKTLIDAIYARMYLYRKNYPLAKQYAQDVITGSGLVLAPATPYVAGNFYAETTTNPYRRMWADTAGGEIILSLSRPVSGAWGDIAAGFFFNTTNLTGGAFLDMGRNLFNELNAVNGDIRRLAFVDPTSLIDPNYLTNPAYITSDAQIIDKYPGKGNTPLRNDLKVFRLSEMYFILAECAVYDSQLNVAAGYIKNIRDARNRLGAQPLPVYASATDAWADILAERRKELCFEGHRYVDIKRLGVLANKSIDRSITDDTNTSLPTTISNTDYRFTLPIPQDEISGNVQIREQQNPNY